VVLEGLARGTPVIGSASGGIEEIIRDGETGLLVEPGDTAHLVQQLERILDDPALARRLSARAKADARQRFSAESVSERVQDILLQAAGVNGHRTF
jgi:glycosyltransferase involved in cell wall biosynthesis